jgi:hypothetical protein
VVSRADTFSPVPAPRSLAFRVKKKFNDLLRRLTGYQFVKARKLEELEAAARSKSKPKSSIGRG